MKGKGIDVHKSTQAGFYQEYPEVYESVKASDFRWFGAMDVKIINSGDHSNLGKKVKLKKNVKGSLDLIPSPSTSVKIQIVVGNKAKHCWVMSANFLYSKVC